LDPVGSGRARDSHRGGTRQGNERHRRHRDSKHGHDALDYYFSHHDRQHFDYDDSVPYDADFSFRAGADGRWHTAS
jgi:hypothetical protein